MGFLDTTHEQILVQNLLRVCLLCFFTQELAQHDKNKDTKSDVKIIFLSKYEIKNLLLESNASSVWYSLAWK